MLTHIVKVVEHLGVGIFEKEIKHVWWNIQNREIDYL